MRIFLLDLTRELYVHAKNLFHGASFPLDKYIAGCFGIDPRPATVNAAWNPGPISASNRLKFAGRDRGGISAPAQCENRTNRRHGADAGVRAFVTYSDRCPESPRHRKRALHPDQGCPHCAQACRGHPQCSFPIRPECLRPELRELRR